MSLKDLMSKKSDIDRMFIKACNYFIDYCETCNVNQIQSSNYKFTLKEDELSDYDRYVRIYQKKRELLYSHRDICDDYKLEYSTSDIENIIVAIDVMRMYIDEGSSQAVEVFDKANEFIKLWKDF